MSDPTTPDPLRALVAVDLVDWHGLPRLTVSELLGDRAEDAGRGPGALGEQRRPSTWLSMDAPAYRSGLRAWVVDDVVVAIEGRHPATPDGDPVAAPALGEPALRLDATLGRLTLDGAERVHPDRGIAVQVNPDNDLLLAVVVFPPCTAREYVERVRPSHLGRPPRFADGARQKVAW